jgi:hypothetical protein
MPLNRKAEPLNHPDWLLEIKWDGFRPWRTSSMAVAG